MLSSSSSSPPSGSTMGGQEPRLPAILAMRAEVKRLGGERKEEAKDKLQRKARGEEKGWSKPGEEVILAHAHSLKPCVGKVSRLRTT